METFATSGPTLLADAVVAALFLLFACLKGRKGIYKSLVPLLVVLAAVAGAFVLSRLLAPIITAAVYPSVEKSAFAKLDFSHIQVLDKFSIADQLKSLLPQTLANLLGKLGVDLSTAAADAAAAESTGSIGELAADAASNMLYQATAAVVRFALLCICFIALLIVLNLLKKTLGLAFRLPVIRWVDKLGGAILGLIEFAILLYIACWALDLFAPEAMEKLSEGTRLLSKFV